jgi:hypothetical protein
VITEAVSKGLRCHVEETPSHQNWDSCFSKGTTTTDDFQAANIVVQVSSKRPGKHPPLPLVIAGRCWAAKSLLEPDRSEHLASRPAHTVQGTRTAHREPFLIAGSSLCGEKVSILTSLQKP